MSEYRNKTYYRQHPWGDGSSFRPQSVTVGELIEQLSAFPRDLPVIYQMPEYGTFGSGITNALDGAHRETLEARSEHHAATTFFNEEIGEEVPQEAYTDEFPAWDGIVLT